MRLQQVRTRVLVLGRTWANRRNDVSDWTGADKANRDLNTNTNKG